MEKVDVPVEDYQREKRISARRAASARRPGPYSRCPCCRDDQVLNLKLQHSVTAAGLPHKRKRTSAARPSKPPQDVQRVPPPQPAAEIPASAIPDSDLPVVSSVAPGPQPSTSPLQHDGPVKIHNRSVEEYQKIYREAVDDLLRYKNGRVRPYSLDLGRQLKLKLWERLDRPTFTASVDEDSLVHVNVSYGAGVCPPQYDVDISGEPKPTKPPKKRARELN